MKYRSQLKGLNNMASSTLTNRNARNAARRASPHKMEYQVRRGVWSGSNVTFDPITLEARSYGWWAFARLIGGALVFNTYKYSQTTQRHQRKVRALMAELGIEVNVEVNTKHSLASLDGEREAREVMG